MRLRLCLLACLQRSHGNVGSVVSTETHGLLSVRDTRLPVGPIDLAIVHISHIDSADLLYLHVGATWRNWLRLVKSFTLVLTHSSHGSIHSIGVVTLSSDCVALFLETACLCLSTVVRTLVLPEMGFLIGVVHGLVIDIDLRQEVGVLLCAPLYWLVEVLVKFL